MNKPIPAIQKTIKQKLSYAAQRGYVEPKDYDELVNLFLNERERITKALRLAYRAGQDSVSCMTIINGGKGKPNVCICIDDEPCTCKGLEGETSSAEDEAVEKLLAELKSEKEGGE